MSLSILRSTAATRLLVSDFTTSLTASQPQLQPSTPLPARPGESFSSGSSSNWLLPAGVANPALQELRLPGPIPVQVLDIEDIGSSAWSQVEAIEKVERGETTRGRQIIRTVNRDEGGDITVAPDQSGTPRGDSGSGSSSGLGSSSGPHRLVLQDAKGTRVAAIELRSLGSIAVGATPIGMKMVLRNAMVARGLVLLEPACVTILGGRIDSLDKKWRATRKASLLARLEKQTVERTSTRQQTQSTGRGRGYRRGRRG